MLKLSDLQSISEQESLLLNMHWILTKNSASKGIIIILGLGFPSLYRILPKGLESDNYSNLWHGTVLSDDGEAPQ